MKCNHCGAETADDSVFCEHCGNRIEKKKKGIRPAIWISIAIIVIAAIVAVVIFLSSDSPETKAKVFAEKVCECMSSNNNRNCVEELNKESENIFKFLGAEDSAEFVNAYNEAILELSIKNKNKYYEMYTLRR